MSQINVSTATYAIRYISQKPKCRDWVDEEYRIKGPHVDSIWKEEKNNDYDDDLYSRDNLIIDQTAVYRSISARVDQIEEATERGYDHDGAARFTKAKDYRKDLGSDFHDYQ